VEFYYTLYTKPKPLWINIFQKITLPKEEFHGYDRFLSVGGKTDPLWAAFVFYTSIFTMFNLGSFLKCRLTDLKTQLNAAYKEAAMVWI
jgi:hypothetical protein